MNAKRFARVAALSVTALAAAFLSLGAWRRGEPAAEKSAGLDSWTLVHARPAVGKYEDLAFPDATHGWLISASGFILHTADGGATWTEQARGMPGLRSIDMIDRRRGFAGTIDGKLYGTTDGGAKWTDITASLPKKPIGFCGMTHVGERVHLVGRYHGDGNDYFFSPDGGKTWRVSDLGGLAQGLVEIRFLNDSVGFIGGKGRPKPDGQSGAAMILRTIDGGKSWRKVFEHDGGRGFAWKIHPIDARVIYAGLQSQDGTHRIAKSTDGGVKWQVLTVATGQRIGPGIQGIGFISADTGWVGGFFPGMFGTTDGGKTWTPVVLPDRTLNRFEPAGGTLFTAGSRGVLRFDGGRRRR